MPESVFRIVARPFALVEEGSYRLVTIPVGETIEVFTNPGSLELVICWQGRVLRASPYELQHFTTVTIQEAQRAG